MRKGQLLFVIDQVPYQAALAEATANVKSAEASLATAQLNLKSSKALHEKNVVQDYVLNTAKNELAVAEAALAQAKAKEISARNNLSYTEVKSPVDGVASMIAYRVGALVSSSISEPLVTLSDDKTFVYKVVNGKTASYLDDLHDDGVWYVALDVCARRGCKRQYLRRCRHSGRDAVRHGRFALCGAVIVHHIPVSAGTLAA